MNKKVIVTNIAEIEPKLVLVERISILANSDQTGSYEVYLHDAPEGAGPQPQPEADNVPPRNSTAQTAGTNE